MPGHHFISYSRIDGSDFAVSLADALAAGPPPFSVWLDQRCIAPGADWDTEIAGALKSCDSLLYVMTRDSVRDNCACKQEWSRALRYKKRIVPLLLHPDAEMPFRLESRQHLDCSGDFEVALARLRRHLQWLATPEGVLQGLRERLADAERDLQRSSEPPQQARVQADIDELQRQITAQERLVQNPQAVTEQVAGSIAAGLERERQRQQPPAGAPRPRFINPLPAPVPGSFQNRHVETGLIADFLRNTGQCLLTISGRGGIGKTALACRVLEALEQGRLPDDLGPLRVHGMVFLSATGRHTISFTNLFTDLCRLLPADADARLQALFRDAGVAVAAKMQVLLEHFSGDPTIVLLDNFEELVAGDNRELSDAELHQALAALLNAARHSVKVIITTRVAPADLARRQPARQMALPLDEGLASPHAENLLRALDPGGTLGLQNAADALLDTARRRTRGFPRALEALAAILAADRESTLAELLAEHEEVLPEQVVEVLVGDAFTRLDTPAQRVLQALAVYGQPVPAAAVDYLLQPYLPGIDSAPLLNRLLNMALVRKEEGRYYLHPVDRAYALGQVPPGEAADRANLDRAPLFSRIALADRGAGYFKATRLPQKAWRSLAELAPQLAEFDLRCAAGDYDTAAEVLREIGFNYLLPWGHARLVAKLHERLQGKIGDKRLQQNSAGNLGSAFWSLGEVQQAISCYEKALALAREEKDRWGEGTWLGNLGSCYSDLGETGRAIEYHEQALKISREIGDRRGEGADLGNLGSCYSALGEIRRAIELYEQALDIAREIGDRRGEGSRLGNLAEALIDDGRLDDAQRHATASVELAGELDSPDLASFHNTTLALARLQGGEMAAAGEAAAHACSLDVPANNHNAQALRGVIALRQHDRDAAQQAFSAAIAAADALLARTPELYNALDAKALALCGLALCDDEPARVAEAVAAYRAARAINKDAGIVRREQRLLDVLAEADPGKLLAPARQVLATAASPSAK